MQLWELGSYVVTVVGLPVAIGIFLYEQRKERENEEEAGYLQLSDAYAKFLELVLANPDLQLRSLRRTPNLTPEQHERMLILFDELVSLFERAYIVLYDARLEGRALRRWRTWEDWIREWCRREDFRDLLADLLRSEDAEFAAYIRKLAAEEMAKERDRADAREIAIGEPPSRPSP
jgi:hypothetical protein